MTNILEDIQKLLEVIMKQVSQQRVNISLYFLRLGDEA